MAAGRALAPGRGITGISATMMFARSAAGRNLNLSMERDLKQSTSKTNQRSHNRGQETASSDDILTKLNGETSSAGLPK